jgi:hypothetical protein
MGNMPKGTHFAIPWQHQAACTGENNGPDRKEGPMKKSPLHTSNTWPPRRLSSASRKLPNARRLCLAFWGGRGAIVPGILPGAPPRTTPYGDSTATGNKTGRILGEEKKQSHASNWTTTLNHLD